MKRILCLLLLLITISVSTLSLFGFASGDQYPVYSGTLSYVTGSSSYTPVLTLSGSVEIWLNDYSPLTMSEQSYLLNAGVNQLIGEIRHSSGTYPIRMPAGADYIEVYQERESTTGNYYTYFDYNLRVEEPPATIKNDTRILWFIASFFIVLIPLVVIGRFAL